MLCRFLTLPAACSNYSIKWTLILDGTRCTTIAQLGACFEHGICCARWRRWISLIVCVRRMYDTKLRCMIAKTGANDATKSRANIGIILCWPNGTFHQNNSCCLPAVVLFWPRAEHISANSRVPYSLPGLTVCLVLRDVCNVCADGRRRWRRKGDTSSTTVLWGGDRANTGDDNTSADTPTNKNWSGCMHFVRCLSARAWTKFGSRTCVHNWKIPHAEHVSIVTSCTARYAAAAAANVDVTILCGHGAKYRSARITQSRTHCAECAVWCGGLRTDMLNSHHKSALACAGHTHVLAWVHTFGCEWPRRSAADAQLDRCARDFFLYSFVARRVW